VQGLQKGHCWWCLDRVDDSGGHRKKHRSSPEGNHRGIDDHYITIHPFHVSLPCLLLSLSHIIATLRTPLFSMICQLYESILPQIDQAWKCIRESIARLNTITTSLQTLSLPNLPRELHQSSLDRPLRRLHHHHHHCLRPLLVRRHSR